MNVHDLSALIAVREFAFRNYDNINFKMSNEEVKQMRNKITLMDKAILEALFKLDLTSKPKVVKERSKKNNEIAEQLGQAV